MCNNKKLYIWKVSRGNGKCERRNGATSLIQRLKTIYFDSIWNKYYTMRSIQKILQDGAGLTVYLVSAVFLFLLYITIVTYTQGVKRLSVFL